MPRRLTVVVSQGQSQNPVKRGVEEDIVATLMMEPGIDVTVIPHLYDLTPDGTGMLCLQGISGDFVVLSWLYERAARWTLDRNDIRGQEGVTLVQREDDDDEDVDDNAEDKARVTDSREIPNRKIYCIDLRIHNTATPYIEECKRIAKDNSVDVVELTSWIKGTPQPDQMQRYLDPGTGNGNGQPATTEPTRIEEDPGRRWYPVIDFSRCTNCMECIDFCLFGVYGVDHVDTILVEQPDNCRKGCPACSRVCPENAIIFPQHKTPTIAGSSDVAGSLKIDLSQLFGKPNEDPSDAAVRERDEQLILAGREAVGATVGMPKRQVNQEQAPKDELDNLMDELDSLDL